MTNQKGAPMSDIIEPGESSAVQLTRMEGKLDRVVDRVSDLRGRVDSHEAKIDTLQSQTQSLREGFDASEGKAVALALALKEAKEAQEATVHTEATKAASAAREAAARSALGWSPITRLFAVVAAVLTVIVIYQALLGA